MIIAVMNLLAAIPAGFPANSQYLTQLMQSDSCINHTPLSSSSQPHPTCVLHIDSENNRSVYDLGSPLLIITPEICLALK